MSTDDAVAQNGRNLNRTPVVLDVDTGADDALALLLALRSPQLDVRAVTCVAGNTTLENVVANTLKVLDAAGAGEVPVGRGMDRPLVAAAYPARHVHGEDGMGDLDLPVSKRRVAPVHAVELLRQTLTTAGGPVTLVPLAPLTNIATLLRTYPAAAAGIDRIVLMGGAARIGNVTATAEFNVWHDPEAAAIVFGSGIPITMYGLEVFYQVTIDRGSADELAASTAPAARLAGRLLQHQSHRFGGEFATIGDAGAVAAVIEPAGLTVRRHQVRVELTGELTRGMTVVDQRAWTPDLEKDPPLAAKPPPGFADVAFDVDVARYRELFLDIIAG